MAVTPELTRIMNDARISLPGALDTAIKVALFQTVDEFISNSNVWREDISIPVNTTNLIYDVESEDYTARVNRLMQAKNSAGIPVYATMAVPGELVLKFPPQQPDIYVATVALSPVDPVDTDGYPRVCRWIIQKYRDGILDGLLGRMMSQPAKPYASERLAIYHMRRFRNAIATAKTEANKANLYDAQAWRYPRSFA